MACCGREPDDKQEGMVEQRRCRDVLFLLLFVAYWGGMFAVCGLAFQQGDPRRLIYATDSRGLLCGANNSWHGAALDLTAQPNLYYLNALELLDPTNLMYAKSVCVDACPGEPSLCDLAALPCTAGGQYRCPYYSIAEQGLAGRLTGVGSPTDTAYWAQLASAAVAPADCNATFLQLAASATSLNLTALGVGPGMCSVAAGASVAGTYLQATSQFPGRGPCYAVWAATVPYFNRCFPKFPPALMSAAYSLVNTSARVAAGAASSAAGAWAAAGPSFSTYVADISKGVLIIVIGGLGGGMVLSLVWMLILRYAAGLMVWATIALVDGALAGCALYAYAMAGLLGQAGQWGAAVAAALPAGADPTGISRQHWAYIAYGLSGLTGLIVLLTLVMVRRIRVAVACIKVASQAVSTMPSVLLWPLLPFVLEVGLVIYWVAVTAVLYSAGQPTPHWRTPASAPAAPLGLSQLSLTQAATPPPPAAPLNTTGMTPQQVLDACAASPDCYVSLDWDDRLRYAFIYHLFGLLWTNQFIVALSSVVVAGATASYYWAAGDARRQPTFPVLKALRNTVLYHLGSVALGSCVIAVIQFVRFMLEYVDKKSRQLQQANKLASWALCLLRGALWLLEKVVAFINRNAFILVAVKGSGYCSSAGRAVSLVVANALRLAAVNVVGDGLLLLGKLGVAGACGLAGFGLSNLPYYRDAVAYPSTYLSSAILPVALTALTGFVVAQIFFAVYEMAIDTVLLCFCEDCEAGGGHPRCAPALLLEAVGEAKPQQQPHAAAAAAGRAAPIRG